MLAVAVVILMQAVEHKPGDYSSPHPTTREMSRGIRRCGGKPRQFTYHTGHQMLTLTGDETLRSVDQCIAEYAQRFGVIPMYPLRVY